MSQSVLARIDRMSRLLEENGISKSNAAGAVPPLDSERIA